MAIHKIDDYNQHSEDLVKDHPGADIEEGAMAADGAEPIAKRLRVQPSEQPSSNLSMLQLIIKSTWIEFFELSVPIASTWGEVTCMPTFTERVGMIPCHARTSQLGNIKESQPMQDLADGIVVIVSSELALDVAAEAAARYESGVAAEASETAAIDESVVAEETITAMPLHQQECTKQKQRTTT